MPARRRATDEEDEDHVLERNTDWMRGAPRWLLLWGLLIETPIAIALGTFGFNMVMYRLAEIQTAYGDPTKQAIADLHTRINGLEIRVAAVEIQMPPLAQKVDKIDENVEKLLKRGR